MGGQRPETGGAQAVGGHCHSALPWTPARQGPWGLVQEAQPWGDAGTDPPECVGWGWARRPSQAVTHAAGAEPGNGKSEWWQAAGVFREGDMQSADGVRFHFLSAAATAGRTRPRGHRFLPPPGCAVVFLHGCDLMLFNQLDL